MSAGYVYGLFDPRQVISFENCRYVGQTVFTLNARQYGHIADARHRHGQRHTTNWIRQLLRDDVKPFILMFELIIGNDDDERDANLDEAEQVWIAHGRANGWRLTNQNDGGNGNRGWTHTPETRAKISAAITGQTRSAEQRANMSAAQLAREHVHSEETKALQSQRALERLQDPAELQRLGDISRAHKLAEDKTPTMCECGCGPFKGPLALTKHLNKSPFHSEDPLIRDFCLNGHEMTPENIAIYGIGSRYCRICERIRNSRTKTA